MAAFPDQIRLVIKNYPYKYRDFSRIAAEASLAAGDQGKYWEMHEVLLSRSPKLDRASLIGYAEELGLDMIQFTASLDGNSHGVEIDRDIALAQSMDLFNTPTYYINGRQVIGDRPFAYLQKIILEELKEAGR